MGIFFDLTNLLNSIDTALLWLGMLFFCFFSILFFLKIFGYVGLYVYSTIAVIAGNIQVLNSNQNSIYTTDYLGIDSIIDIAFHDSKVFAVYTKENEIGILEFNYDEENIPYYLDSYKDFPEEINSISDIDIFQEN